MAFYSPPQVDHNTTGFEQVGVHRFGGDLDRKDLHKRIRRPYLWLNSIKLNKNKI